MYCAMSPSSCARALVYCGFPLPPGTSLSGIPPSSLYCCHKSVSRISAAARKRRMSMSPCVGWSSASALDGIAATMRPTAPGPTSPLRRNERREVGNFSGSIFLTIVSYRYAKWVRIGSVSLFDRPLGKAPPAAGECRQSRDRRGETSPAGIAIINERKSSKLLRA